MYDRNNPRYPYKSHGQWLKACYGLVACTLLVLFNGIGPFLEHPFDTRRFIASYIGVSPPLDHAASYLLQNVTLVMKLGSRTCGQVPAFVFLILGYKIKKHGLKLQNWGPERSNDLKNTIQTNSNVRVGRLELPDEGFWTKENLRTLGRWVWVWLK
jgi:amino acid transporter